MFFKKIFFLVFTLPFLCFGALDLKVQEHVLHNGLRILLYEDHTTPVISYYTWFNVGSAHEKKGQTGIAHLFEHMMFQGTKKYGKKQYDTILANHGGQNNAFTSQDYTAYYVNIPSEHLELVMDLESDRMVNLNVTQENLTSEREVVKEEKRSRYDNSPFGKMYEVIFPLTYPENHPYSWPTIGSMKDLNSLSVEECMNFYKTYYAPNNATIVLVGDFDLKKTLELFEKYYRNLESQNISVLPQPESVKQKKEKIKTIYFTTQSEMMITAYHGTSALSHETYALDVLGTILSDGKSSRLYKKLIYEDQVATGISAAHNGNKLAGTFNIRLIMKPGLPIQKGEKLIIQVIENLKKNGVTENELQKSKNQILSSFLFGLKSKENTAYSLGANQIIFGDYRHFFEDIDKYNEVTKEDVLKVAQKYLHHNNKNTVYLKPLQQ
ncbi:MAG: insulinase family protein [Deltaproteobacteria bacterium]|nr:insulinase family protein [Deltaproteobacteria bacterium]